MVNFTFYMFAGRSTLIKLESKLYRLRRQHNRIAILSQFDRSIWERTYIEEKEEPFTLNVNITNKSAKTFLLKTSLMDRNKIQPSVTQVFYIILPPSTTTLPIFSS